MGIYRGIGGTGDSTSDATLEAVTQKAVEADASADAAAISETNAASSASSAQTYAGNASTSATAASSSAASAATSAATSTSSATTATTKASEAATSATNAASSATSAATSASTATTAKDAALAALDSFDDKYLGAKASDPSVDNDGNALSQGTLYYNTTSDVMKVYNGSVWVATYVSLSGALLASNNLSDVTSASSSRTNLGLGTIATQAANNVNITGGSISSITDLAVVDGGTGASTASGARTNLGLVIGTDVLAPNGSAASLTNFPTFNQSTSGNAATVTTNANLIGDVTSVGNTSTVVKINGTSLASLSTGILKNTTTTGVPTVAIAGTDYQAPITLTTTGTGAATLSGTTLNIPTASSGSTHYIGESYGGGIVFYIWDGGAHGLIGANTELNGGQAMTWGGGSSSYVGTTSYNGVLGGKMNTQRILNVIPVPTYGNGDPQTGQRSAAFYAATYLNSAVVVSGVTTTPQFSDWYLPNAYELTLFATQSSYFPNCNFATHDHWSSSERSDYAYLAYALGANSNTYIYQAAKTSTYYVVAIRSF
jgi:hypothetical protein